MSGQRTFINLDAAWLANFADEIADVDSETAVHLLRIAENLQSLDEKNSQMYQLGRRDMEAELTARSNILSANPPGEDLRGAAILSAISRHAVTRVPLGERTLEDKPHLFNAPVRKKPKPVERKADVQAALDLSLLLDL